MSKVPDVQYVGSSPAVEDRVVDQILATAQHAAERLLFVAGESGITVGQVADDALRFASGIMALGLKLGECVVVQFGNLMVTPAIVAACLASDAIFVPLIPAYTAAETDACLRKLRPLFYFCEAKCYPSVADIPASVLANKRRFVVGAHATRSDLPSWRFNERNRYVVVFLHAKADRTDK
jgi:acyl-CoA synthetase (AMP-forming)/AMP-acid ligase II